MSHAYRILGLLLLAIAGVFSVHGQETAKPQSSQGQGTQTTVADDKTATKDYVFPTSEERFKRYVNDLVGPMRLARSGVAAGIDQWRDTPEEWGQGAEGYGRRFASGMGRSAIQTTVTYGLDSLLDLDTGFRRSKRDGFFPRLKHALAETVTSRTKSGKRVISAPRLVGVYTGSVIAAEGWYPERYSYKDGLRQGTATLLTNFGINMLREFVIKF